MTENEFSKIVLEVALKIHKQMGPGLLESVYESILVHELSARGLVVKRHVAIPVVYEGVVMEIGFRADIIVENKLILEIKSVEIVPAVAYKCLLTYLRLTDSRLGILINFGEETLKSGFKRVANQL